MMVEIKKYNVTYRSDWNDFIHKSKNGVFLFNRDYMDYHADCFVDHSLVILKDNKIVGLLPANELEEDIVSHGGLTFGGLVTDNKMKISLMIEIFHKLVSYFKNTNFKSFTYKAVPKIYHLYPAEEDLYALFVHNAQIIRRDASSTIDMRNSIKFSKDRRHYIKVAHRNLIKIRKSNDYGKFMSIVKYVLNKYYNVQPVHSAEEIQMLANRFPDNIKLFAAYKNEKMLSGVIIYENSNVAHAQYIFSTDEGKLLGATEIILEYLICEYYSQKRYFDFGISTEKNGKVLNTGLASFKESFGARTTLFDFYKLSL